MPPVLMLSRFFDEGIPCGCHPYPKWYNLNLNFMCKETDSGN